MLSEDQLEQLRARYGKIGVIDYGGHQLVFRRPTRDIVRDYRRKQESPAEKPDALDQLAQAIIVAFDDEQDGVKARTSFNSFLDEYPLFTSSAKSLLVMNILTGVVEVEEAEDLGKGASVKKCSPEEYADGLTNWFRHIVRDEELTNEGRVAAQLFAETNIGERLFWEALRKS